MPKMDVPRPVYNWLLIVRAELRVARGRNVTWPETFEYVQQHFQATDPMVRHVKEAGR